MGSAGFAQQMWERTYGGTGDERARSVQQTTDGGCIAAGWTNSFGHGGFDIWVVKTDALGDTLWTRTFGGAANEDGTCVRQTADGGYVVLGQTVSFANNWQVYLIRLDSSGDTLWTRVLGSMGDEYASCIQATSDGGYIITGLTGMGVTPDAMLLKTNASGDTTWVKAYGGWYSEWGRSVQQTSDGGYIVVGQTSSFGHGGNDVYLIKTNASGDTFWSRTFGGPYDDFGYSVQQTEDGGYIVAGVVQPLAGSFDMWLIKTDAQGETLWTRTYGGSGYDDAYSLQPTPDRGYIVAGATSSFGHGSDDAYLVRTNASGDTLWTRTYGGASNDRADCVGLTSDGGFVLAGFTSSFGDGNQFFIVKTDREGRSAVEEVRPSGTRRPNIGPTIVRGVLTLRESQVASHKSQVDLLDISGRRVMSLLPGPNDVRRLAPGICFVRQMSGVERAAPAVVKVVLTR